MSPPESSAAPFAAFLDGANLSTDDDQAFDEATLLALLSTPDLEPIRSVVVRGKGLGPAAVQALMDAGPTVDLSNLRLSYNPIGDQGLQILAASPRLAQIENLELWGIGHSAKGIAALAASPYLKANSLYLGDQDMDDASAEALLSAENVQSLLLDSANISSAMVVKLIEQLPTKSLTISGNPPISLQGLAQVSPHIETLQLGRNPLTDADLQILASVPAPALRILGLAGEQDALITALQGADWWEHVELLNGREAHQYDIPALFQDYLSPGLGGTLQALSGIGEGVLLDLLAHPGMRPIRSVQLRDPTLTARSAEALMNAHCSRWLYSLSLSSSPIGDAGLVALAESPRLAQLEYLNIQDVGATPKGIATLAASAHLRVKDLVAGWQPVGDQGAKALAGAKHIQDLRLEKAEIGTAGAVALIEEAQVRSLTLIENPIHLVGLTKISPHLKSLTLSDSPLMTEDIQILASLPAPGLTALSLEHSPITDEALYAIMAAPWFGQLRTLSVSAHKASKESRQAFIEAYKPHGTSRWLSIYTKDL